MQSPLKMPEIDLSKIDLSKLDLTKLDRSDLPKFDLSEIEIPKVDVGKAIADAAASAGLATRRRSRWPYILGAGVVIVLAGWAAMNAAAIRERLSQAKAWIGDQVGAMPPPEAENDEFTPALASPFDQPAQTADVGEQGADYPDGQFPDGLGVSEESMATNGRSAATSRR